MRPQGLAFDTSSRNVKTYRSVNKDWYIPPKNVKILVIKINLLHLFLISEVVFQTRQQGHKVSLMLSYLCTDKEKPSCHPICSPFCKAFSQSLNHSRKKEPSTHPHTRFFFFSLHVNESISVFVKASFSAEVKSIWSE